MIHEMMEISSVEPIFSRTSYVFSVIYHVSRSLRIFFMWIPHETNLSTSNGSYLHLFDWCVYDQILLLYHLIRSCSFINISVLENKDDKCNWSFALLLSRQSNVKLLRTWMGKRATCRLTRMIYILTCLLILVPALAWSR